MYLRLITLSLSLLIISQAYAQYPLRGQGGEDLLTFPEIKSVLSNIQPDHKAVNKLGRILNTAFSYNKIKSQPANLQFESTNGQPQAFIRVTQWNLESLGSQDLENEFAAFNEEESSYLRDTDIFTLNNVGFNNEKSQFKNMAAIFAQKLDANYLFAPEFLEASPEILEQAQVFDDFKALSGNAIVSKHPFISSKLLRLPACYDWFVEEEKHILSQFEEEEYEERKKVKTRAGEGYLNLIRRGGRVALIANILLPNSEILTVVSAQLENRTESTCRKRQLESLLHYLKDVRNPLVLGVDMNNFGKSAAPKTIKEIAKSTLTDPMFYVKKVVSALNPFSPVTSVTSLTYGNYRKMRDPTVKHIPILLPNKAYKIFKFIHEFKFDDGWNFDFSGERDLANSNARKNRKYIKTYEYKSWLGSSKAKLDWIFVKPIFDGTRKRYLPKDAMTLNSVAKNEEIEAFSLHYPVTIKLML